MKVFWLATVMVGSWLALTSIAVATDGPEHWWPSSAAAALCGIPALGTLVFALWTEHRTPAEAIGAVLLAPLVRIVVAVVGGAMLGVAVPALKEAPVRLIAWGLVYYLIALIAETLLLLPRMRGGSPPTAPGGKPG